jgi:predicted transcriptional regulator
MSKTRTEDDSMTGYFYTYNIVFDAPVSGTAKLAYAYLCKCANREGVSYPSHKVIAAAAGVSVTTTKKALAELERARLISIRGQARPDRGRRANVYTVMKETVKGFFVTYGSIFIQTLTAKARLVYLYFCRLASGRDEAFPAHKTTAAACGLSVSGARLAIDELEAAGLVSRQAQFRDNGGQRANLYTLIDPQGVDGDPAPANGGGGGICKKTTPENATGDTISTNPLPAAIETADTPGSAEPSYSSSNCTSSSSGKSSRCETVMPSPCETRCNVRSPGLFVFPLMMLSSVDCFMPESVASLLSVIPRSLHRLRIRSAIASEYVMALTSLTRIWLAPLYWLVIAGVTRIRLTSKLRRDIITHMRVKHSVAVIGKTLSRYMAAGTGGVKHPAMPRGGYRNLIHKGKT